MGDCYYDVEVWKWYGEYDDEGNRGYGQTSIGTHLTKEEARKLLNETELSLDVIRVELWFIGEYTNTLVAIRNYGEEEIIEYE